MNKKLALGGAGLLGVVLVAGLVWYLWPRYTLAKLAPKHTVAWAEAQDLQGSLEAFKEGPCWEDFQQSESNAQLEKGVERLQKLIESEELGLSLEELDLELDERAFKRLLGQNVAIGVVVPKDRDPSLVFMTRIDVVGLVKDAALDGKNWKDQWSAWLSELKDKKGFSSEEVEGYTVVTREGSKRGLPDLHFVLVEETFVLSHDKKTVEEVIAVHKGDAPSLASKDGFDDEYSELDDPAAFAWVDLDFVRDGERVEKAIHASADGLSKAGLLPRGEARRLKKLWKADVLAVLKEDLNDEAHGVAVGFHIPEGNLYGMHLSGSREAEDLFQEDSAPDPRGLVGEDALLYIETRDLLATWRAFKQSEALETVMSTRAAEGVHDLLARPQAVSALAGERDGPTRNLNFEVRAVGALIQLPLEEVLGNDLAIAVEGDEDAKAIPDMIRAAVFLRARPAMRILIDIGLGMLEVHGKDDPRYDTSTYRDHKIWSMAPQSEVALHVTRLGSYVVAANQLDHLWQIIDRFHLGYAKDSLKESEVFEVARDQLPDGYVMFAFYNLGRVQSLVDAIVEKIDLPAEQREPLKQFVSRTFGSFDHTGAALYVDDDFESSTTLSYSHFADDAPRTARQMYPEVDEEPEVWGYMPESTFLSVSTRADIRASYKELRKNLEQSLGDTPGAPKLKDLEKTLGEMLAGKDLEDDIIAHLGDGVGVSVSVQKRDPPDDLTEEQEDSLVTCPALQVYVKLDDPDALEESLLEILGHHLKKTGDSDVGLKEVEIDGQTVHVLRVPDELGDEVRGRVGDSFAPCFAFVGDFFILSSSRATLEQSIAARKGGASLATSEAFDAVTEDVEREVPYLMHVDSTGFVQQLKENARPIARHLAPGPESLKAPEAPEHPDLGAGTSWREYEKEMAVYRKKRDQHYRDMKLWRKQLKEWREENVEENAAAFEEIVDSLRVFGHMVHVIQRADEDLITSKSIHRLDLEAVEK